jgi:hypothetical protein
MNASINDPNTTQPPRPHPGLSYARGAGRLLGIFLIVLALKGFFSGGEGAFEGFKSIYFLIYGILLNLPYQRIPERNWKPIYGVLVITSAAFVFVMIASVMFAYMAAAEIGERLGVPGFEGSLIFLALMQVPVVLFQRKPDLLD